jgi:hypothetical protein
MRAADRLDARFRHAEVPDLPLPDQFLHAASDVFHRDFGVDSMLVEQVDVIRPEPL